MRVSCTKYSTEDAKGATKAFCSFRIDEFKLNLSGCKLIETKSGATFISFPSKAKEVEGKWTYEPYIEFDRETALDFQDAAKEAVSKFLSATPMHQQESVDEGLPF